MTRRLLGLREVPKPDDTADALAIAICHGQTGGTALKRRIVGEKSENNGRATEVPQCCTVYGES